MMVASIATLCLMVFFSGDLTAQNAVKAKYQNQIAAKKVQVAQKAGVKANKQKVEKKENAALKTRKAGKATHQLKNAKKINANQVKAKMVQKRKQDTVKPSQKYLKDRNIKTLPTHKK